MPNAEYIAALERAAELCDDEATRWSGTIHAHLVVLCRKDAALLRKLADELRQGGERAAGAAEERARVVGWLERRIVDTMGQDVSAEYVIDAIEAGAHDVKGEG